MLPEEKDTNLIRKSIYATADNGGLISMLLCMSETDIVCSDDKGRLT